MRNSWKKAAAFMLSLALVTDAVPVNVGTGGLFDGRIIVVNAIDPDTVTFSDLGYSNAETVGSVEAENCTITLSQGSNSSNPPK